GFTFITQSIRTGIRHKLPVFPGKRTQIHAVWYLSGSIMIVRADTVLQVKQMASQARIENLSCFSTFKFLQATQGTAITKGFPLTVIKLIQFFIQPKLFHYT